MNKCLYRNWFYVRETILDFLKCNKRHFFVCCIFIFFGFVLGLFLGLNNIANLSAINLNDQTIVVIFSSGNILSHLICNVLKYAFFIFLILTLNNFPYIRFLSHIVLLYLSFCLIFDCVIIVSMCGLGGVLYCLFYTILCGILLFLLAIISALCKISCDSNGNSSKFCCYPYKNIVMICLIMFVLLLVLSIISKIFSNFLVIIV